MVLRSFESMDNNNHDDRCNPRRCHVPRLPARRWGERRLNCPHQVIAQAKVQPKTQQLEELEKERICVAQVVRRALHGCKLGRAPVLALEKRKRKDLVQAEVAIDVDRAHNLDKRVPGHAALRQTDLRNQHLWVRLQFSVVNDRGCNKNEAR